MSFIRKIRKSKLLSEVLKSTVFVNCFVLCFGFLICGLVVLLFSRSPLQLYKIIFDSLFSSPKHLGFILVYAAPLIMLGLSVGIGLKMGYFNIGVESQFIVGSLASFILGSLFDFPIFLHPLICIIFSFFCAGMLSALVAFLKVRFNANEVVSGIMLNWILFYVNILLVEVDLFRQPDSEFSIPIKNTADIEILSNWKISPEGLNFRSLYPWFNDFFKAPVNWGIIISIFFVFIIHYVLFKTRLGFKISALGSSKIAAKKVGIDVGATLIFSVFLSGGLAGIAGAIQTLGFDKHLIKTTTMLGIGLNGIPVALIGSSSPLGIFLASFLFAILLYSSSRIQILMSLSDSIVEFLIGIIVVLISSKFFFGNFIFRKVVVNPSEGDLIK